MRIADDQQIYLEDVPVTEIARISQLTGDRMPYVYLVVEELEAVLDDLKITDKGVYQETLINLRQIARMGRKPGVGLIAVTQGTVDLRALGERPLGGPVVALAAALVVIAALSRSAQVPFHRWLPATLAAPTPVSALLHAGVVNAGGVLLIGNPGPFGVITAWQNFLRHSFHGLERLAR